MSNTVDERVVSMQFDNRNFENNVRTSMSTLERLKQSLKLTGASKSLENVSNAAKKFDMTPMGNGIDAVKAKFSALDVMAVTALANITNSAVNAGINITRSLTITPLKDGLSEYENQINSVQTIMANTGDDVKTVNAALDELNDYADLTIYNFAEMTSNAGTFTAALGEGSLEKTMTSLKGIGNWAAYAGANASDMSRATFQLGQALASGTVRLQDWMSIEHTSGMAGKNFQEAFKKTAKELGTDVDAIIEKNGSFRESLRDNWLTTEVFMKTMETFANDESMTDAATKVKTFSQLIDTTKEALGTGWATTWRTIIGDFEEAKELFTGINEFLSGDNGIITKISDSRNRIVSGVMESPISQLAKKVSAFSETTNEATNKVKDLGEVVDKVIRGDFGNGEDRVNALTKAGYNWAEVQNEVNKKLGSSFRHVVELTDAQKKQTKKTEELTDAKLKKLGLTKEEIKLYRELEEQSKKTGKSMKELLNDDSSMSGRELLIQSFKNIGKGLITILKSIGHAWKDVFRTSEEEKIHKIYSGIQSLNEATVRFANVLKSNGEEAKNIKNTFRGLFAVLDLIRMVIGGGLSIAFKVINSVLEHFKLDILDVTSSIGENIYNLRNWIKEHDLIKKAIEVVIPFVEKIATAIYEWAKSNEALQNGYAGIKDFLSSAEDGIRSWIEGLKNADNIPEYIITGLVNGIKNGISRLIPAAQEIAMTILETVKFIGYSFSIY